MVFGDAIASFGIGIETPIGDSQAHAKTGNDIPKHHPSSHHRPSADSHETIDLPVLGNDIEFAGRILAERHNVANILHRPAA